MAVATMAAPSMLEVRRGGLTQYGAKVYYYDAGTTTPKTVYKDSELSSPWENPVPVDGDGIVPVIYVGVGDYKFRIIDAAGGVIREVDGLQGAIDTSGGGGGTPVDPNKLLRTGQLVPLYARGVLPGLVRANGNWIGSAASGANERANADCQNLFVHLWSQDADLPVFGGRGSNALSDWNANKAITLPDWSGRALFGLDDQGAGDKGRLTGGLISVGDRLVLSTAGGLSTHTLTEAQLAAHAHGITVNGVGDHAHGGVTDTQGNHSHTSGNGLPFQTWGGGTNVPDYLGGGGSTQNTGGTNVAGAHAHNISTYGAGAHSHSASASNTGSSQAHNTLPPFHCATIYLAL